MRLASSFLNRVSYASVYKAASVSALHCPACGVSQEDELQLLQPCMHLACVYDQEAQEFTYKSDDFKQREALSNEAFTGQLSTRALSRLGYADELLALELTRAGCWSHELFAFNFNVHVD
ncbi:hypothetical protein N8381_01465 [Oceanospirillaceae bacterium]|jgi:hypothetical protein|uniref:hypothetical protein n=1 Tax=Candidatus Njordibacter sp. Uisw_002 TaxID=3230971 RepID=UPI00236A153D|nr:hypothetical protein [Oceanospirillaceae bacterium]MDB9753394.1 hypothetical protein [Oceanospirillaceae bacterium]MDB9973107.1 hypothetical protein [Oceanospirillaceae bacterium]MDC1341010.1 hypothetical protein [Oceanospirillaceae bacterium]MDC1509366.1 hypothetical protein [Oceanospirillaceae bacterium]|tara:strand:- start:5691 stop:6050 length:360 start_codon:yes stop_codon:yes gene_type:complete